MLPGPMSTLVPLAHRLCVHTCKPCLTVLGHLLACCLRGGFPPCKNSMRMLGTPCAQKQGVAAAAGARQQQCKGVAGGCTERTGGLRSLASYRTAPALRHAHHGVCACASAGAVCRVIVNLHLG